MTEGAGYVILPGGHVARMSPAEWIGRQRLDQAVTDGHYAAGFRPPSWASQWRTSTSAIAMLVSRRPPSIAPAVHAAIYRHHICLNCEAVVWGHGACKVCGCGAAAVN